MKTFIESLNNTLVADKEKRYFKFSDDKGNVTEEARKEPNKYYGRVVNLLNQNTLLTEDEKRALATIWDIPVSYVAAYSR